MLVSDTTCRAEDCAVERFLQDIPINIEAMSISIKKSSNLLARCLEKDLPAPSVIAATSSELADQLIKRSGPIPLGSRHTWIDIQKSDKDCRAVFNLKNLGDAPR